MVRLVCIVEFAGHGVTDADSAQEQLDRFREAVLPEQNYGITIYRATEADADVAIYLPGEGIAP